MDESKLAYGAGISRSTYPNLITYVCMQFNNQYAYHPYVYNEKWIVEGCTQGTTYRVYYF